MNFFLKKSTFFFLCMLMTFGLTFTSCDDDEGVGPTDPEVITTVRLVFSDGTNTLTFEAVDADGDGGNPPVVDDISLSSNTVYMLSISFLDESDMSDVGDITVEIAAENLEHLVCFTASGFPAPTGLSTDDNGDPLGLQSTLSTGEAAAGSLGVALKHEPDKAAADACATGETDVEVVFAVEVN